MSPQFVDYDADGHLDIVAGIYDGSPYLVRGTPQGWAKPEQILDRNGARIVLNAFWNYDTRKWDQTNRHDAAGASGSGHATSALAFDLDGDGDLDLLLGDHRSGRVFVRSNEGTRREPKFSTINVPLLADGKPIDVPGTVATMRLVDWNGDGRMDLACGGMGDAYNDNPGGGVFVFLDVGKGKGATFGPPIELLAPSKKGGSAPTRPDSGLYMDFADYDGDGDLDMVVGGYSHWSPPAPVLTAEQQRLVEELRRKRKAIDEKVEAIYQQIEKAAEGLSEEAADKKREELFAARAEELQALQKQRQELDAQLDPLVPGKKRHSYVWLYENLTAPAQSGR